MDAERPDRGHGDVAAAEALSGADRWMAVASGLARAEVHATDGPAGPGVALDYDFAGGGGFVVARCRAELELPDAWELVLRVKGRGPANTLEIKIVDAEGSGVWRWSLQAFEAPQAWTELRVPSRGFVFAWGPAGGGSVRRTSALEIAVVAGPGGSGCLEFVDFRIFDRSPGRGLVVEASSEAEGHDARSVIDDDHTTTWRSGAGAEPPSLTFTLASATELGALVVDWDPGALPSLLRVDGETDGEAAPGGGDGETDSRRGGAKDVGAGGGGATWTRLLEVATAGAPRNFLALPPVALRRLRLVMTPCDAQAGVGVTRVSLKPAEWAATPSEFLSSVALASPRGWWPRYLLREQALWTPVASPASGAIGLLGDDGAVEVGEGGFLLEPSLYFGSASTGACWRTWADGQASPRLEAAPLPVATVSRRHDGLCLEVTAVAEHGAGPDRLLVRYRLTSCWQAPARVTLYVALRPLQVTPPWQSFRNLGGPSPIRHLAWNGETVNVNDSVDVVALEEAARFGAAGFDEGGVAAWLSQGRLPVSLGLADPAGRAEGVLAFDVELGAGSVRDVFVECRLPPSPGHAGSRAAASDQGAAPRSDAGVRGVSSAGSGPPEQAPAASLAEAGQAPAGPQALSELGPADRVARAIEAWREALAPMPVVGGHDAAVAAGDAAVTCVGHVLSCRDGAALQPGPRRYTRSWIRDGALTSAALLRWGRPDIARDYVDWYAPFQREDGFVPCCVDRDGVDPLVEHDSHGQFVFAVAETYRFTRDAGFARRHWPGCAKAAAFIEQLRETRKTGEFRSGSRIACFGLLPESVSHEGYLAQPVHSYWDDFWALRGLGDAAFLAAELGDQAEARRWRHAADDLAASIRASIVVVMRDRGLETLPASVEWADFDPTALAGAVSLVGAADLLVPGAADLLVAGAADLLVPGAADLLSPGTARLLPPDALQRTFDVYMEGWRARREGLTPWTNYTPYEVRIVGALVRMGRRDDANQLLDFLLADRRPAAWGQWPEIAWRDPAAPAHLGDLPHCWIGAEYAISLRSMFAYEREADGALVLGAGLRREWLDSPGGVEVKGLPTWYGALDLSIRRGGDGRGYEVRVAGEARPPGGFVALLPDGEAAVGPGTQIRPRAVEPRTPD